MKTALLLLLLILSAIIHASAAAIFPFENRIWEISKIGYDAVNQINVDYDNVAKVSSARALGYDERRKRSADVAKRRYAAQCASIVPSSRLLAAEETVFHTVTSSRAGQGVLSGISPKRLNPSSRFGEAFYVSNDADTTLAELTQHGATGTQTIRLNLSLNNANVLDLTNPSVARAWNYTGGPITPATRAIGSDALNAGFNVIKYPSLRGPGVNYGILNDFDTLLTPQMIVPVP